MVGDLIAGRYELEELVGRGGMSSVYRARDRLLERTVAIKLLHEPYAADEELVERFRREARAAARLSHPNVVTVIDRGEADGRQFIVFEYVEGRNLKQLVEQKGALPVRAALELVVTAGRALAFAHEQGLVHRDVKPQNILLGNGDVKVTDFGIARSLDAQSGLTQTGTVLGTSDYIAPEQARGQPADALSDVYSLGCVLYELLAGEPPFTGESFLAVAMRHVQDPVPSLAERRPDVPLRLDTAVQRAMAKDPAGRFASMGDFVTELEACLEGLGSEPDADRTAILRPGPATRRARPRPRPWRRRRLLLLGAVIVVAGGSTAAILLSRNGGTAPTALPLAASSTWDPEGDRREHDELLRLATDGELGTAWETERYSSTAFGGLKSGVGIVLDAGRAVEARTLSVLSDTPGFTAEIRAGAAARGPFETVSEPQTASRRTTFALTGPRARYYLIWITRLAPGFPRTHVNEVEATR